MHLIAPLASGVRGAENGAAHIYRRGTSSRISYYLDFEATAATSQSSSGVQLDSNGGAVVYVDVLSTVVVKSSNGTIIRTFVAGDKDSSVEVISAGFVGSDYVTGASAASKPTTLQAVLDKWITSAGATDFNVLLDGSSVTLQNAVKGVTGFFYNVKSSSYGATGDGTTDDYAAIAAAISAAETAGGGVVLLPPGTYRITQMLVVTYRVSLLGAGPESTHLKLDASTASGYSALHFDGTTATHYSFQQCSGFRITCAQANTKEAIRIKDPNVIFSNIEFIGSSSGFSDEFMLTVGSTAFDVIIDKCTMRPSTGSTGTCFSMASGSTSGGLTVLNSAFVFASGLGVATPGAVDLTGTTGALEVRNCNFDASSATASVGYMIRSAGDCKVSGCRLSGPASGAVYLYRPAAIAASGGVFVESGNHTDGASAHLLDGSESLTGIQDQIKLYSRNLVYKDHTAITAASLSIDATEFGSILIQRTSGAALTVNGTVVPPIGHTLTLTVWNDGTGGALTVTLGTGFKGTSMVIANNTVQTAQFVSRAGPSGTVYLYQIGTPRDETE